MKTFEERYTAWIDGQLEGPALTSFELELSRRAAAGEARADKEDAVRLHHLLTTHLKAPALTNPDFFNHQLRERIATEQRANSREEGRSSRWWSFDWSFARLGGLAAGGAFVAIALYYGMAPSHSLPSAETRIVEAKPAPANIQPTAVDPVVPSQEEVAANHSSAQDDNNVMARNDAMPTPVSLNGDLPDVHVLNTPANPKPAPLQPTDPNESKLWINGLNYNQSVPGAVPTGSTPPLPQTAPTLTP